MEYEDQRTDGRRHFVFEERCETYIHILSSIDVDNDEYYLTPTCMHTYMHTRHPYLTLAQTAPHIPNLTPEKKKKRLT